MIQLNGIEILKNPIFSLSEYGEPAKCILFLSHRSWDAITESSEFVKRFTEYVTKFTENISESSEAVLENSDDEKFSNESQLKFAEGLFALMKKL